MVKVGIIGCGKISEVRHAPEYAENPNCQIVGFFDVYQEKAQEILESNNSQAVNNQTAPKNNKKKKKKK